MSTNAQTQERLDALEEAISQGVTSVSYDGKTVSYRRLSDMERIRDTLRAELGLPPKKARPSRPRARRGVVRL